MSRVHSVRWSRRVSHPPSRMDCSPTLLPASCKLLLGHRVLPSSLLTSGCHVHATHRSPAATCGLPRSQLSEQTLPGEEHLHGRCLGVLRVHRVL